jgi:hypothetical protein
MFHQGASYKISLGRYTAVVRPSASTEIVEDCQKAIRLKLG